MFPEHADDLRARPLRSRDLDPDPLRQFGAWFREAEKGGVALPEAAALATASRDGKPSARMVLLKGFDERGFVFHTGYGSRKGRDLADNPRAALLVHWPELGRQVRIEGRVDRVPREESEAYFRTRPRGGQLAAWASRQSSPIESRDALEGRFQALEARYAAAEPPLPDDWGGFRVAPDEYEFWQHRENRLHDRFRYRRHETQSTGRSGGGPAERQPGEGEWLIERLQP